MLPSPQGKGVERRLLLGSELSLDRNGKSERTSDLKTIGKKTKLRASFLLLVTYIQLCTGFKAQLQL